MSTVDEIYDRLLEAKRKPDVDYGGNVLPAGRIFSSLKTHEEVRACQDALEGMLSGDDAEIQSWAVNVCLGFVVFRDAIEWPKIERAVQ
jgi:hypothetical protein